MDPRFHFLLKTMVAVKSSWNAQTKKVGTVFGIFDIEQIIIFNLQVFYDRHIV